MDFKIIKELKECKTLWNKFSKNESLWDLWDIVNCFYDSKLYEPYFIVSVENSNNTGLLPLWFDKSRKTYFFFGGEYPENHDFWFDISNFSDFIAQIPGKFDLYEISKKGFQKIKSHNDKLTNKFEQASFVYFINLEKIGYNLDNHLKIFSKKHRKNLKYDLKQLEKINYELIYEKDEHFDNFVELSVNRFGKESDLSEEYFVKQMRRFTDYLADKGMLYTICIKIDKKIEGIEFAAFYNGVYYVLNGASNIKIENLGKLLIMSHIKNAIGLKAKQIDFLASEAGGWKDLWNLEQEEYYDYSS